MDTDWFSEAETPIESVSELLTCSDDLMGYEFHENLRAYPSTLKLLKECPQIAECKKGNRETWVFFYKQTNLNSSRIQSPQYGHSERR